jgi:tetratricopeptide (TPR) repeat protein
MAAQGAPAAAEAGRSSPLASAAAAGSAAPLAAAATTATPEEPPLAQSAEEEAYASADEGEGAQVVAASELQQQQQQYSLDDALAMKARGNAHFQAQEYESAIECYTSAIELAPPNACERAVFLANRAACYAKQQPCPAHESVVADCTAALEVQPDYTKALLRRAVAREALEQFEEGLQDARRALELEPGQREAAALVPKLEKAAADKLEKTKEEMMSKLKDLGNTVLGNFGLSLDNFKANQDPATGNYNISFQQ